MTVPSALPPPARVRWSRRGSAIFAVLCGRLVARLSPGRIRALLGTIRIGAKPASYAQAKEARDAVCAVNLRCAAPRGCLPRSLATVLLCRMNGVWPTWCTGVRASPPFGAHAWVETNGNPVDEGVRGDYFRPLITVAAPR